MKAIYQQFQRAIEEEDVTQAKVFLFYHSGKINLDRKDKDGKTLLHHSCEKGSLSVVRLLIDHGASIEIQDNHGNTCLHYGCMFDNFQVVRYLLTHCANVFAKNKDEQYPADVANDDSPVKILVEMGMSLKSQSNQIMTLGRVKKNKRITRTRSSSKRALTEASSLDPQITDNSNKQSIKKIPSFRRSRRSSLNACRIKKMHSFGNKDSPKVQTRKLANTKWSSLQALRRSVSEADIFHSREGEDVEQYSNVAGVKIHKIKTSEQINLVGLNMTS